VCGDELGDDRKAEPTASLVARTRAVETDEALEDALTVALGDAGAVVVHPQQHGAVPLGQRERHAGPGMPGGVVAEVVQHPPQPGDVPVHAAGGHR
jgi:hypothetical protein